MRGDRMFLTGGWKVVQQCVRSMNITSPEDFLALLARPYDKSNMKTTLES
jgi:hypothetical protein